MRKIWKYVRLASIRQVKKDETICFYYPHPCNNFTARKEEEEAKRGASDAKAGKCKILVWREVEVEDDWMPGMEGENGKSIQSNRSRHDEGSQGLLR